MMPRWEDEDHSAALCMFGNLGWGGSGVENEGRGTGDVTEHTWKKMKLSELSLKGKTGVNVLAREAEAVGKDVLGDCIKNKNK